MSKNPEKPYIGITGVELPSQARAIADAFVNEGLANEQSNHRGMLGVLISQRTLKNPRSGTLKYPALINLRQIFEATNAQLFNTLHYNTYDESCLSTQLATIFDQTRLYADRLCEGIQLNIAWPNPSELEKTVKAFPDLKIILQLGPRVLSEKNAKDIAEGLTPYDGLIDYVLIDPSGGRGMIAQITTIAPVYHYVRDMYPTLPIALAGGFNAENVNTRIFLLTQIIGYNDFGIDAQEGLRVQRKGQQTSDFSMDKAIRYIHNAAHFFKA